MLGGAPEKRLTIVYCRVSSAQQKEDLASQVLAMQSFCLASGVAVDEWVKEVGGGMNFRRKQFISLVDRIQRGEISKILVAHKDRLMRFGFELFEHIAVENGCEIVVLNQDSLSPQQEIVEDLMSIVHTFSSRLEGIKKYEQQIKSAFPEYRIGATKDHCE